MIKYSIKLTIGVENTRKLQDEMDCAMVWLYEMMNPDIKVETQISSIRAEIVSGIIKTEVNISEVFYIGNDEFNARPVHLDDVPADLKVKLDAAWEALIITRD